MLYLKQYRDFEKMRRFKQEYYTFRGPFYEERLVYNYKKLISLDNSEKAELSFEEDRES